MTSVHEIHQWTKAVGAQVKPELAANTILYGFIHRSPPFRYLLIYTDPNSEKVIHADWCGVFRGQYGS